MKFETIEQIQAHFTLNEEKVLRAIYDDMDDCTKFDFGYISSARDLAVKRGMDKKTFDGTWRVLHKKVSICVDEEFGQTCFWSSEDKDRVQENPSFELFLEVVTK